MKQSITIRRATLEDAMAIAIVQVSSWHTTYPGIVDQSYIDGLSTDERAAAWSRRLGDSSDGPGIFVAERSVGELVGFISGGRIRMPELQFDAELYAIYLLAGQQRHGLGTQLVRAWAETAVDRGFRAAIVRVLAANSARAFYERLGAHLIKQTEVAIGGRFYPELWYGWNDLRTLIEDLRMPRARR